MGYMAGAADMPLEKKQFQAVWEFQKQFYNVVDTEDYYAAMNQAASRILEQYRTQKCHDLLWAVIHECERRARRKANGDKI